MMLCNLYYHHIILCGHAQGRLAVIAVHVIKLVGMRRATIEFGVHSSPHFQFTRSFQLKSRGDRVIPLGGDNKTKEETAYRILLG